MDSSPHKPKFYIDIFLQPGEFYFGDHETRIRTLLGSCVAVTIWHPRFRIGGMCHYLLPMHRGRAVKTALDGRYAEDAMTMFMNELHKTDTWPHDYEVKMFGGGSQFPGQHQITPFSVPGNNINVGRSLLKKHGFKLKAEHLGGTGHRNVVFDVWNGQVWLQHVAKK